MTVRDLRPEDAPELVALFRRCYGDTYGTPYFYDEDALVTRIDQRLLRSVVVSEGDRLIGHMGITIRHPDSAGCETGNTVVDPEARGKGLLKSLAMGLTDLVVREGFCGYVHYPTTAHDIMQRASVSRGGRETGIMLAYVPAETDYQDFEEKQGRLAVTIVYQPLTPPPERAVSLPERYREVITNLYEGVFLKRSDMESPDPEPAAAVSVEFNQQRKSLHAFLGDETDRGLEQLVQAVEAHDPEVSYVDLLLDRNDAAAAVESLRSLGYFFCGVLPEFARTDVLRMQRMHAPEPDDFAPDLANESGRELGAFIREDAASVGQIP